MRKFPGIVGFLLRLRYGKSSEHVLGDVMEEYTMGGQSKRWVWRQLFSTYGADRGLRPTENTGRRNRLPHGIWNDVRYAARTMARNPGFAALAVITIALGVGVNSGIFSLLNAAALRPLPVSGAARIVSVYQIFHGKYERGVHGEASLFSTNEYQTYRDTNHVFSGTLAYAPFLTATLGGETPRQVSGQFVSCNYFDVLGERPVLGRGFGTSDCAAAGAGNAVVLSDDMWRGTFASDPAIVGKNVILNRQMFTVAGVAPPGFHGTEVVFAAFWVPFTIQPTLESNSGSRIYGNPNMSWLVLMGKMKDGETLAHVRADLEVINARVDGMNPGMNTTLAIDTATFASMPEARSMVTGVGAVILAAVAMVLLIVCANLANLLLARAAGRQREIAIRLSVGATRGRLIRQLMTESLMVALLGGAIGTAASFWSFNAIVRVIMMHLPRGVPEFALNLGPDFRVLGYSLAMTILTGIAIGLLPALRATKFNLSVVAAERSGGILRGVLVGAQVAACMILLIASGLMLHALYAAQTVDPGFEMKNILAVSFNLRNQGYTRAAANAFQTQAMERIAALPGVDGVAQAILTPLSDDHWGREVTPSGQAQEMGTEYNMVSPGYLPMLGIPIVRGRNFAEGEEHVAMVSESAARRFWPDRNAVGETLTTDDHQVLQVVGIVKDTQVSHLGRSNETYVYLPLGEDRMQLQLLVHSAMPVEAAVRAVVRAAEPNLAVEMAPLEDNLEQWRTPSRIVGILAGTLGGLALLIAAMGIYGVTAFAVSRRVREIGIRMALGADAGAVKRLILRQSMRPVLIGAVVGIAGCAGVSQVLSSMLFGVSAYDLWSFVGVPVVLIAIALLASGMPARRATRVDPMVALRHE
jgi:macrolide transport system ATP-binding/permease protein